MPLRNTMQGLVPPVVRRQAESADAGGVVAHIGYELLDGEEVDECRRAVPVVGCRVAHEVIL